MKTYKFSNTNIEFSKELRRLVKEYFSENNRRTDGGSTILFKTLIMATLYLAPFAFMLTANITSVAVVLGCYLLMGLGMSGLGTVTMHDANHGSFSKHRWVNRLFSNSLYLLGGFPPNWRFQHNTLHHGYTNVEGHDEDIAPVGVLRFSPHQPLKKVHRFQYLYAWFFYSLMTISWITTKDFKRLKKYEDMGAVLSSKNNFSTMLINVVVSKVLYYGIFLVVPLIFIAISWYWILASFIVMHFTSGFILSIIFQTAHVVPSSNYPLPNNNNELEYNWMVHQLFTTSDFSPKSKLFSWAIGGLNFQVIHHLFPNISHIHYKNIAPIVEQTAQKYDLPYYVYPSFLKALVEHTKMLKQLGGRNSNTISLSPDTLYYKKTIAQ